jgi:hypothetical protein
MKSWLSNRIDFIDEQLVQPPRFRKESGPTPAESVLTLAAQPKAKIYYTLDDSDPRSPQGGISPKALLYTNPVPWKARTRIVARAHDPNTHQTGGPPISTPWSSAVKANSRMPGR